MSRYIPCNNYNQTHCCTSYTEYIYIGWITNLDPSFAARCAARFAEEIVQHAVQRAEHPVHPAVQPFCRFLGLVDPNRGVMIIVLSDEAGDISVRSLFRLYEVRSSECSSPPEINADLFLLRP